MCGWGENGGCGGIIVSGVFLFFFFPFFWGGRGEEYHALMIVMHGSHHHQNHQPPNHQHEPGTIISSLFKPECSFSSSCHMCYNKENAKASLAFFSFFFFVHAYNFLFLTCRLILFIYSCYGSLPVCLIRWLTTDSFLRLWTI